MRSEAQKRADKKYSNVKKEREGKFSTTFTKIELEQINEAIKASGMSKAEFIRWAVKKLKEETK